MATLTLRKVSSLPTVLEASTLYLLKNNNKLTIYLTDKQGEVIYRTLDTTDISSVTLTLLNTMINQPGGLAGIDLNGIIIGISAETQKLHTARKINGVSFDGTIDITIPNSVSNTTIELTSNDETRPLANILKFYRKQIAGRQFAGIEDSLGSGSILQNSFFRSKIGMINPPGNIATAPTPFGMQPLTATGTLTARNVAAGNYLTMKQRQAYVSASTVGSLCGFRIPALQVKVGGGDNFGGFFLVQQFSISDPSNVKNARMFVGPRNSSAAPTNVNPTTLTNAIGIGCNETSTNMFLYYGGSAAQTPIDLGTAFPGNTLSTDVYELALFSPHDEYAVYVQVTRLNTGDTVAYRLSGTAGVVIPATTTLLSPTNSWRTNNTNGSVVAMDLLNFYSEDFF